MTCIIVVILSRKPGISQQFSNVSDTDFSQKKLAL